MAIINRLIKMNSFLENFISVYDIIDIEKYREYLSNLILIYYTLTKPFVRHRLAKENESEDVPRIIISLTTIPSRIDSLWLSLESLYRQKYPANKIILYLARDEFRDELVPKSIEYYLKRGLEIVYCDNLKSHKKYYYTMKKYPKDFCLTVDDDIIYSEDLIANLMTIYRKHPDSIIFCRANIIKKFKGKYINYKAWKNIINYKNEQVTERNMFFTTGAGTLFPSWKMPEMTFEIDELMKFCPTQDDIWLNYMARIGNIRFFWTGTEDSNCLFYWPSQIDCLSDINIGQNENDKCLKLMMEKYGLSL